MYYCVCISIPLCKSSPCLKDLLAIHSALCRLLRELRQSCHRFPAVLRRVVAEQPHNEASARQAGFGGAMRQPSALLNAVPGLYDAEASEIMSKGRNNKISTLATHRALFWPKMLLYSRMSAAASRSMMVTSRVQAVYHTTGLIWGASYALVLRPQAADLSSGSKYRLLE